MSLETTEVFPQGNQINAGVLVGRPDLSDDVLVEAVAARLASLGRSREEAADVVCAAHAKDGDALAILSTIAVPPPVSRLAMPVQTLTRGTSSRFAIPFGRFLSIGRS